MPVRRPVRNVYGSFSDRMTLLVPVGMAVAIVPVLPLLLLAGLRVFLRFLVVVRTIRSPGLVFVVVPERRR